MTFPFWRRCSGRISLSAFCFLASYTACAAEPTWFSIDLSSRTPLSRSADQKANKCSSGLIKSFALTSELLKLIDDKKITWDERIFPASELFSQKKYANVEHTLQNTDDLSVRDLIKALIFLRSKDSIAIAEDFLESLKEKQVITSEKKSSSATLSDEQVLNLVADVLSSVPDSDFKLTDKTVQINSKDYPSRIKTSRSVTTELGLFNDSACGVLLGVASVKDLQNPENTRKVAAVLRDVPNPKNALSAPKTLTQVLLSSVNNFKTARVFKAGETVANIPLSGSKTKEVPATTPEDVYITVERADEKEKPKLEILIKRKELIKAPLSAGSMIGKVNILYGGKIIKTSPLIVVKDVAADESIFSKFYAFLENLKDYLWPKR